MPINFSWITSLTNKGFLFVSAFSLGKPAVIFNFKINVSERTKFQSQFRFILKDGRNMELVFGK
jgi:hypothetical protein